MEAKQHAKKIYDLQKFTIQYFLKQDFDEEELHLLTKQLSLNLIRYTSDKISDNISPLEIFNIKEEIENL